MPDEKPGKSLTRTEFEAVMKRASELSASDSDGGEAELDEAELFRIGREVGLSDAHVRRALLEVRSAEAGSSLIDVWMGPRRLRASRVVPGSAERLREILDEFMVAGHLLQPIRQGTDILLYRPAVDWISHFARAGASLSERVYWASAKEVEVRLNEVEEGFTFVELVVDPGIRGDYLSGAVFGGFAAGGAASYALLLLLGSLMAPPLPLITALASGGGVAAGVAALTGRASKKKHEEVKQELEGVLDSLERGDDLSPPPASWRRWVKRQAKRFRVDLLGEVDS
ncbi:MAG: hypothetical protein BMS9Abin29_2283 [Gemmatimonadota bacterium]|nr:MAG: hypothetical protein BMS9Abin29_2283 [Gemmatimonadota bacterium]